MYKITSTEIKLNLQGKGGFLTRAELNSEIGKIYEKEIFGVNTKEVI